MTSRGRGVITKGGVSRRKIALDMSQVEQWENVLRSQPARVDRAGDEIEFKNATELANRAKAAAPRSRGARSRSSAKYGPLHAQIKPERLSGVSKVGIGSAFYGFFQERGAYGGRLPARPFFGPAIKKQRRPFQNDVRELVLKLLRRIP